MVFQYITFVFLYSLHLHTLISDFEWVLRILIKSFTFECENGENISHNTIRYGWAQEKKKTFCRRRRRWRCRRSRLRCVSMVNSNVQQHENSMWFNLIEMSSHWVQTPTPVSIIISSRWRSKTWWDESKENNRQIVVSLTKYRLRLHGINLIKSTAFHANN